MFNERRGLVNFSNPLTNRVKYALLHHFSFYFLAVMLSAAVLIIAIRVTKEYWFSVNINQLRFKAQLHI